MNINWNNAELMSQKCYVIASGVEERTRFLEFLEKNGFKVGFDDIITRDSVIVSTFPISIDIKHKTYGHIHSVTSAAAAISSGNAFTLEQFYDFFEQVSEFIIV